MAEAEATGTLVVRHPADKDATDWELALRHVAAAGYERVIMLGGAGGRLDHLLANALVLTSDEFAALSIQWHIGTTAVTVARPGRTADVRGEPGEIVTLLTVGAPAEGVTTTGLRWGLKDDVLPAATSRGVSNELVARAGSVSISSGAVLVIHEGEDRP